MLLNKINVSGTFSSENGNGIGTKIQLGNRDLGTGEIEIIGETYTVEKIGSNNYGTIKNSEFFIEGKNVKVYEGGKQLIIIYNGKYIEVPVFKENILGLVGHIDNFLIYDTKTSGDIKNKYEANYIENTKTTIFDDPLINWYIHGDTYTEDYSGIDHGNKPLLISSDESEIMKFYNSKLGIQDEGHGVLNIRPMEISSLEKSGKGLKEITELLFLKTDVENLLIRNGFDKNQIEKIKKEGMLKNMNLYQEKFKADWVKREEENMNIIRNGNIEGSVVELTKKKEETDIKINIVEDSNNKIREKENINKEVIIKEEIGMNNGELMNLILGIFIIIGILILFVMRIIKKIKEKRDNDIEE